MTMDQPTDDTENLEALNGSYSEGESLLIEDDAFPTKCPEENAELDCDLASTEQPAGPTGCDPSQDKA